MNELIRSSASFLPALQASIKRCLSDSNSDAVTEIDARLLKLQQELLKLANAKQNYDALADEIGELRAKKEELLLQEANFCRKQIRMDFASAWRIWWII